jgi:hypothetical protein
MGKREKLRSWRAFVAACSTLGLIATAVASGASADFSFALDDGAAGKAGNIDIFVDFVDAAGKTQNVKIPNVAVAKGDTRTNIRDAVSAALGKNARITGSFTLSDTSVGFGQVQISRGTDNAGVKVLDAHIANTGGVTGVTFGGGIRTAMLPPVGGGFNGPYAFFSLTGGVGTANDVVSVVLEAPRRRSGAPVRR